MVFAQFVMERSIELITEPIAAYTVLTQSSQILPKPEVVRGILIAHEIFHYLEEQHGATMYHITKTIPLWRFFPTSTGQRLVVLRKLLRWLLQKNCVRQTLCLKY